MSHFLDNIRIVLMQPSHPGNIGAVARAMKNMGLSQLYLVEPRMFPHAEATERAAGADDVLKKAVVVNHFSDAIAGCGLILGTSARPRALAVPCLNAKEAAEKAAGYAATRPVAWIFGRERTGLTNEELGDCHYHVQIPAHSAYSSLNLAQAVQVIAYELWMQMELCPPASDTKQSLASAEEMLQFYEHLEKVLIHVKFLDPTSPKQLMLRLKRLFNRAQVEETEINILRGILKAIEKTVK